MIHLQKKNHRGIESRINFVQKRLPSIIIVYEKPNNHNFLEPKVTLEMENKFQQVSYIAVDIRY